MPHLWLPGLSWPTGIIHPTEGWVRGAEERPLRAIFTHT
jgi:hypothetical protein